MNREKAKGFVAGAVLASAIGSMPYFAELLADVTKIYVPATQNVADGYVIPGKMRFSCLEKDPREPCKTIVEYNGRKFVMMYDGKRIVGTPYEIKPLVGEQK